MTQIEKVTKGLSDREKRACEEYVVDFNWHKACLKAKYSKETAKNMANKHSGDPRMRKYVDYLMQEQAHATYITAQRVLIELGKIAFSNLSDFVEVNGSDAGEEESVKLKTWEDLSKDQTAAVETIMKTKDGWRIKLYSKIDALELIGRHFKMFVDNPTQLNEEEIERLKALIHAETQKNI